MKRISTAAVAAATAMSLATVPAFAQDADTASTVSTTTESKPTTTESKPTTTESKPTTTGSKPTKNTKQDSNSSGSSQGTLVAVLSGTLGAVLTTSLIVLSDPRGANKIIDLVNNQFGLGIPHLNVPKIQLPNLPF